MLSSSYKLNAKGEDANFFMTCLKIYSVISCFLDLITSYDIAISSSFFLCSEPQTNSVIISAQGFTSVSTMPSGFYPWQSDKQHCNLLQAEADQLK